MKIKQSDPQLPKHREEAIDGAVAGVAGVIGILAFTIITHPPEWIISLFESMIDLWDKNPAVVGITGILVILGLGYLLNVFKQRNQKLYGQMEIIFSIAVSVFVINKYLEIRSHVSGFQDFLGIFVPFITAVYFTQRGFNNYMDGYKKLKKESDAIEKLNSRWQ